MERKRHLPRRILRTAIAYLILNAGIFGWIQVSAASGNKLQQTETVMAQVRTDSENKLRIAVLGKGVTFNLSPLHSREAKAFVYACSDPVLLGAGALLDVYGIL
ncbi:MAG: hypothetical protein IJ512_06890 [Ruminococcus sp.]|nr:hypothetical protein [Ruminococcus sp.]